MAIKYVLVTGCDSGFGYRLVEFLQKECFARLEVVACFHSEKGMSRFLNQVTVHKFVVDITSDKSVSDLYKQVFSLVARTKGELFGIVNNAGGLLSSGPIEWSTIQTDQAQMDLNFFGAVRVTRAFLGLLRESRGRIIMVSSVLGLVACPFGGSYSASKFALEGWADSLRREMLPFGVRVSIIEPGIFKGTSFYDRYTDFTEKAWMSVSRGIKAAYGGEYKNYVVRRLVGLREFFGDADIDKPVKAMLHALTSETPHYRYRIGIDCSVFARIVEYLPTSLSDLAMTVTDSIVTWNRSLVPVFPSKAVFRSQPWRMIVFAISGYSCMWLLILFAAFFCILIALFLS